MRISRVQVRARQHEAEASTYSGQPPLLDNMHTGEHNALYTVDVGLCRKVRHAIAPRMLRVMLTTGSKCHYTTSTCSFGEHSQVVIDVYLFIW